MIPVESGGAALGAAAAAVIGQINVEIDGLVSAAAVMRDELEQGYRSQVPQVHDAMQPGATIGDRIEGEDWRRLQDRYDECIQKTLDSLFNLDLGTEAVAQAADKIAANYQGSDAFAHATVSDVQEVLPPPEQPAPGTTPANPAGGGGNG
ncbi:hypothetical protein [Plantactinospora soyae]|uniref:Uncharacterized protein n=1 Tax=Plantactinospora soyae TaxID=1544732 RepID=A0A927M870_9ACTN|nr:hypothetical protein [Plantactinospora soyae]MBE1488705.1 hypothetical protein [Plantactinospora soyae]